MTRRHLLLSAAPSRPATGLTLNEDPNHFFAARASRRIDRSMVEALVDQYAGTQVRELMFCVNAMRAAYPSKVRTTFWEGYDPAGPDHQPLFASLDPATQKAFRRWVHAAWQMQQDGLDHFALWLARARKHGIGAWLSVRMNDLHNVEDERHPLHSAFWKAHPEYRRLSYRGEMRDKALDFNHAAVRDHVFALVDELASRYDFDGLELDWMRHGFHFAPGQEDQGRANATAFMQRVRQRLGRKKKIAVRVPGHPETAWRLGLDAVAWARAGAADFVIPSNFWRTADTAMPIALWRQLLPASCWLGAGLELGLHAYPTARAAGGRPFQTNSLETVRGAAAAYLDQGAQRVYLFNYMDQDTAMDDLRQYGPVLRECGTLETIAGRSRRHVVTYPDTFAPGEPRPSALPASLRPGNWTAFRLATGPASSLEARVRLGLDQASALAEVRVNGALASLLGKAPDLRPGPDGALYEFSVPKAAVQRGETVIDIKPASAATLHWVELAFSSPGT